jgi:hypothetical protein
MSVITERKIEFIVDCQMNSVKKMKKSDLFSLVRDLLADNIREMDDYTIEDMYTESNFVGR